MCIISIQRLAVQSSMSSIIICDVLFAKKGRNNCLQSPVGSKKNHFTKMPPGSTVQILAMTTGS